MIISKPFYLLRHGLSEANKAEISAGGAIDSPLTDEGRDQARVVANILHKENMPISRIFHSPMSRAAETAALANSHRDLQMEMVQSLHEVMLGEWEGKPWSEIAHYFERRVAPPGGESEEQHILRVRTTLDFILDQELDAPPLIVAHGGTFHALGYIYDYSIHRINNAHLHYFEPWPENPAMPWKITVFDLSKDKVTKEPAPYCPSMKDILEFTAG